LIYVDPPQKTLTIVRWCHMMTDGDIDELHKFAKKIGLQRHWFQKHVTHPHYDITESVRILAVNAGAFPVPSRYMVKRCSSIFAKQKKL